MNNPMIILIGLAIAAVGTLVAVNVVLPMLARAESQAITAEINTLAGAMWEAKRQGLDHTKVTQITHLLSGWKCAAAPKGTSKDCDADTDEFNSSQITGGFALLAAENGGITVQFKAGASETCVGAASFLRRMNSPFFDVAEAAALTDLWEDTEAVSKINGAGKCGADDPLLFVALK